MWVKGVQGRVKGLVLGRVNGLVLERVGVG